MFDDEPNNGLYLVILDHQNGKVKLAKVLSSELFDDVIS